MIKMETRRFEADITKFAAKAKGRTRALAIESVQDLNEAVVVGTGEGYGIKVVTGFLRGCWYADINGSPGGPGAIDKGGSATISRMNLVAVGIEIGDVYRAANPAAYAGFVHFGTSRMAARPWVHQICARWPEFVEAAAKRVAALP